MDTKKIIEMRIAERLKREFRTDLEKEYEKKTGNLAKMEFPQYSGEPDPAVHPSEDYVKWLEEKIIDTGMKDCNPNNESLEAIQGAMRIVDLWGVGQYGTKTAPENIAGEMEALTKMEIKFNEVIKKLTH